MIPTPNERHGFFGLLLMLSLYLLRKLQDFLQRPFRLSLKAPQSGLSMQLEHRPSDAKLAPTTEHSEMPTTDDASNTAPRAESYGRDSTTRG